MSFLVWFRVGVCVCFVFGVFLVGLSILALLLLFICGGVCVVLVGWLVLFQGIACFHPSFKSTSLEYLDEAFILPRVPMFVTSSEKTNVLKLLREGISTFHFISFRNVTQ